MLGVPGTQIHWLRPSPSRVPATLDSLRPTLFPHRLALVRSIMVMAHETVENGEDIGQIEAVQPPS
jgi:hypothetical protein